MLGLEGAQLIEAEDFEGEETADPAKRAEQAKKRLITRVSLPAHLPRVEQIVDIRDKSYPCWRGVLHAIGEDVSECREHRGGPPAAAPCMRGCENSSYLVGAELERRMKLSVQVPDLATD